MSEFFHCKVCSGEIKEVNSVYHLVQCNECNLVFCKTIFSQEEFVETYDRLYNTTQDYKKHQKEYDLMSLDKSVKIGLPKLKVLKYLLRSGVKNFVEIGAGIGLVAFYLQKKDLNYKGIELDKVSVEKALKLDLNIQQGDFSNLKDIKLKSDAVIAFEVMEHIQDLNLYMKLINQHLTIGGFYGFSVPNFEKIKNYKNPLTKIYQSPPPIHLNFFTNASIEQLAQIYGFEVVFCEDKKRPYYNYNRLDTYKFLLKALLGKYYGPTLMCVMKKKNELTH